MLDGHLLIDAHVHVPVLGSLAPAWIEWARDFGPDGILEDLWDTDGRPRPARLDELFEDQGVDAALLFCEYSPKATGYQLFEDLLPIVEQNPRRFRPVANVNPHLHAPIADEVNRQLDHGAAALKLHPVHGGFRCDDRALYPAYQVLAERGVPLIVHCGTSSFPGSMNEMADPEILLPVVRDFPTVDVVLAHGGRGWWYDAAAFMAQSNDNVWIDLSGLPPKRLPEYYARFDLDAAGQEVDLRHRLARCARHRPERPRGRRARPRRRMRRAGAGTQCAAGVRRPRPPRTAPRRRPAGRIAMTTGKDPVGRPVSELSDEELEQQGKNAHDTRNWVFLNGTAEQFATHTSRMLELEQEYLRRHPKRTWQGSGGAPDQKSDVDVLRTALRGILAQLEASAGARATRRPELRSRADRPRGRAADQDRECARGTDAQAGGAPGRARGGPRTCGAGAALHRRPTAARHRAAGPGDHRRRSRAVVRVSIVCPDA